MAVPRAMRRLLRIRGMEEEQRQAALESALGDLSRLEAALAAVQARERRGRRLVTASAETGEFMDRIAGLEEMRAGRRHAAALTPRIAEAELAVTARRREFLAKRVERRQVESLIQKAEVNEAVQAGRRAQGELDGWFLSRAPRRGGADGGAR
ncbi:MAG: hypothetical protein ABSG10_12565 [Terracidiphilus sp.]|jgi:phage I-like protein